MAINVNQDYSQFYVGTEQLKNYGSNQAIKKDTLVKYRFNTTDEHGNKVMDKMSREETLQAMKDIRSQYGDNAIVEFSGDGMAALVESKKSGNGADLDKIIAKTPEQRTIPEDMITHLEKKATVGETELSEKAQALLKKLRDTYGDMDFFVADFSKGDNAKNILSKAGKEFSVMFTVEELEKMASDEKYEKEYMERVQGARRMSEQINKEYGFTSISGEAAGKTRVNKIGISINEDGTTTFFAELEKVSQQQRERIESAREEKLAERKKQAGQTMMVHAYSIEELIEQIKSVNWDKAAD